MWESLDHASRPRAAMNEIGVAAERHQVGGRLNNRAENSHQPFRRRERRVTGALSPHPTPSTLLPLPATRPAARLPRHGCQARHSMPQSTPPCGLDGPKFAEAPAVPAARTGLSSPSILRRPLSSSGVKRRYRRSGQNCQFGAKSYTPLCTPMPSARRIISRFRPTASSSREHRSNSKPSVEFSTRGQDFFYCRGQPLAGSD